MQFRLLPGQWFELTKYSLPITVIITIVCDTADEYCVNPFLLQFDEILEYEVTAPWNVTDATLYHCHMVLHYVEDDGSIRNGMLLKIHNWTESSFPVYKGATIIDKFLVTE